MRGWRSSVEQSPPPVIDIGGDHCQLILPIHLSGEQFCWSPGRPCSSFSVDVFQTPTEAGPARPGVSGPVGNVVEITIYIQALDWRPIEADADCPICPSDAAWLVLEFLVFWKLIGLSRITLNSR